MAKAGLLARQDAELRANLHARALRPQGRQQDVAGQPTP